MNTVLFCWGIFIEVNVAVAEVENDLLRSGGHICWRIGLKTQRFSRGKNFLISSRVKLKACIFFLITLKFCLVYLATVILLIHRLIEQSFTQKRLGGIAKVKVISVCHRILQSVMSNRIKQVVDGGPFVLLMKWSVYVVLNDCKRMSHCEDVCSLWL